MSCKKCFQKFNSLTNLHLHAKKHDAKINQSLKELNSTSSAKLSVQKRIFSNKLKSTQSSHLISHKPNHSNVKPLKCNQCKFKCKTLSNYTKEKN